MPQASIPPHLKQKIIKICETICLEEPSGSLDLSCLFDCFISKAISPLKLRATLDKVFLVFAISTNISPIELRDIILGRNGNGYFIQYTCRSRRDVCEYLAMNAAEYLERLPGIIAVVGVFDHPKYELQLLNRLEV